MFKQLYLHPELRLHRSLTNTWGHLEFGCSALKHDIPKCGLNSFKTILVCPIGVTT